MQSPDLKYQFNTASVLIKLIVVNVLVFLIFSIVPWIFKIDEVTANWWFWLPSDLGQFIVQPWSLITYAFLHADFWHILGNMFVLYFFGRIVLEYFSDKRFMTIYILGAMAGGVAFLLAYNLFPVLDSAKNATTIIGASAAVSAIMIFIAAYRPNTEVRIFTFNLKIWHIALTLFILDLIKIPSSANAGGLLAHVGGSAFGFVYARQLLKGIDIGIWWENTVDYFREFFKKKEKKSRMKTVYKNTSSTKSTTIKTPKPGISKTEQQRRIDDILDKISKSGYDSLDKAEKDFLFKAGKDS